MTPKLRMLLAVTFGGLLLDQGSKLWVVRNLAYHGPVLEERTRAALDGIGYAATNPRELVVIPHFLSFVHAQNPAAAMGMMLGFEYRLQVFAVFTMVAVAALLAMYRSLAPDERVSAAAIGFLLTGAVGNAIDRLHKATVTDFLKVVFEWDPLKSWMTQAIGTNEWYTFNIADAAIFVGLGIYLLGALFHRDSAESGDTDVGRAPVLDES